jgi:hypothetical protein
MEERKKIKIDTVESSDSHGFVDNYPVDESEENKHHNKIELGGYISPSSGAFHSGREGYNTSSIAN